MSGRDLNERIRESVIQTPARESITDNNTHLSLRHSNADNGHVSPGVRDQLRGSPPLEGAPRTVGVPMGEPTERVGRAFELEGLSTPQQSSG